MPGYNLDRLNFLVVDDSKHMRALIKTILHSLGTRHIIEAMDGADALKELRNYPADIVICDWDMSPLDGLDFTRLVRTGRDSPNPFVPIIMLTGHTNSARVIEARDTGINEFLGKPISARSMYSRIRSIIENPRPYIRIASYFGPDRRRHILNYKGKEHRKSVLSAAPASASGGNADLNQTDIDALLRG